MSLFVELKRRNVFRVGIAYVLASWLVMQVGEVMAPALRLPDWVLSTLAFFLILGFPLVLIFAWAFEMTPEGLKRERDVDRSQSITGETGRRLDRAIIVVLVLAVGFLLAERWLHVPGELPAPTPSGAPGSEAIADARKAIAVLPFENLSASEENAFFAAGVHEDILTHLSRVAGLRVNSRTSVQQYAGSQLNMRDIAAGLGVRFIVEGSVRRAGNQVRVTAQLIDANTDEHLWAENFDRELTDIFAIQTAIAGEIVSALEAELSPQEAALLAQRPTDSVAAYDLFLKARLALQDTTNPSIIIDTAVGLLEEAVSLDPAYAQAWALLAVAHGDFYWFRADPSPTRLDRMKAALDRAIALQPDLPEARLALASYYYRGFYDYPRALEQLELARSVLPNDPMVHFQLGLTLRRLGQFDRSIQSFLDATEIDPWHEGAWAEAIETAHSSGRAREAERLAAELSQRFPDHPRMVAERATMRLKLHGDVDGARVILARLPDADHYYFWMARHLLELWSRDFAAAAQVLQEENYFETIVPGGGRLEAARALRLGGLEAEAAPLLREAGPVLARVVSEPNAENFAWPHAVYAMYLIMDGQQDAAIERCQRVQAILPMDRDAVHGPQLAAFCAWVAGMAGDTDRALDMLDRMLEVGWDMNYWFLALSPEWDFLRGQERFEQLLARAKARLAAEAGP